MHLLDRFSTHLKETLARGIRVAVEVRAARVEPIHLFFALSGQKGSVGAEIISRFKLTAKTLEQAIYTTPSHRDSRLSGVKEKELPPLSEASKVALEKAMVVAESNQHTYIGTEHLLSGLIQLNDRVVMDLLSVNGVKPAEVDKQLGTVLSNATQFPRLTEVADVVEHIQDHLPDNMPPLENNTPHNHHHGLAPKGRGKDNALDFFATNLTRADLQKNIDPVIGREAEILRVIQILSRRTKNNPVLLGEPGVGKTAIVEGLAKKILAGEVPDSLLNKKIYALDMGLLIAGTIYRGEFEARLRQVMEEVNANPNIILFIDEIHNIVGAGSNQGTMDAGNILKPALSRGNVRCIGATTPAEFKKYIESDAALERRFQPVTVPEPSLTDAVAILKGIKENYETYHGLSISDAAVEMAVRLSDRYISNKFLPDKAIDLLDETAAAKRLTIKSSSWHTKLARLQQRLEKTILAKEEAASTDRFAEAVKQKELEDQLQAEIKEAEEKIKQSKANKAGKKVKLLGSITEQDILEQVARIIHTSPAELRHQNNRDWHTLEDTLLTKIVGQNQVVRSLAQHIYQAQLGLSHPERPLFSALFVGESGVGKTELAKQLASTLYPGREALIKLDMSEFNESFGVSKLLGSPAGYVGYKESNRFTDKIKLNPHCVILFDEIDKAHKEVTKLLLQMLENGEITDATGKKISLKHAILILTTSFGTEDAKKGAVGFGGAAENGSERDSRLRDRLKEFFSVELLNRLDEILLFNPLTSADLVRIAELEIRQLNSRLDAYHTELKADQRLLEQLLSELPKDTRGARDVRRTVRGTIERLLSDVLGQKKIKSSYQLKRDNRSWIIK